MKEDSYGGTEEMEQSYAEDAGADWEDEGYQNEETWSYDPAEEAELAELKLV